MMDIHKLIQYEAKNPLASAADVVGIKKYFESREWSESTMDETSLQNFCLMWMLREPRRVDAYMKGGLEAADAISAGFKYVHVPRRSRRYSQVPWIKRNWVERRVGEGSVLRHLARLLNGCLKLLSHSPEKAYKYWVRGLPRRSGLGQYGKPHLFRTLLLCLGRRFPGNKFLVMGSGASARKYKRLREMGIRDMGEFNQRYGTDWDSGQLAYCFCMCRV